jgi:hypothetical protein
MDTFDGVDEKLLLLTATIYVEASVTAVIVQVGVRGGIIFEGSIDFFDPFPETSGGIVRPYELLCLGSTPDRWYVNGASLFPENR